MEKVHMRLLEYNKKGSKETEVTVQKLPKASKSSIQWLNIDGLHDIELIRTIGEKYGFHSLLLEDILNTSGRPKVDEIKDAMLLVVKMLHYDEKKKSLEIEQVSMALGDTYLVTFQETPLDVFNAVRERIHSGKTRIRERSADYLVYALLDAIVDSYLDVLQRLGERIHDLEASLMSNGDSTTLEEIFSIKQDVLVIQQITWPLEEIVRSCMRSESPVVSEELEPYLRDLEDHARQVNETIETFRMMLSGMQDTYMSMVSNKMNEIMKTLTLISTIFIPLTFVTGVYGMNFEHMPEITWENGYLFTWSIMLGIGAIMVVYFKGRRWL
jgi:magnesium transporter